MMLELLILMMLMLMRLVAVMPMLVISTIVSAGPHLTSPLLGCCGRSTQVRGARRVVPVLYKISPPASPSQISSDLCDWKVDFPN